MTSNHMQHHPGRRGLGPGRVSTILNMWTLTANVLGTEKRCSDVNTCSTHTLAR